MQEPDVRANSLSKAVIGAAIEVHKTLGPGFPEALYEEALCYELTLREIPYKRQHPYSVTYKGRPVGEGRLDILIDDCLVVELKSVEAILPVHTGQVVSYLRATAKPLGILINFNVPFLKEGIRRIVLSDE